VDNVAVVEFVNVVMDNEDMDELEEDDDIDKLDEDETRATLYIFKRLTPPQYSLALALHTMLHPVCAGVVPATRPAPGLITLPQ
jgi:hypothetical protein